jgi:hypothetical protein
MWVVVLMRMDSVDARFRAVEAQSSTFTNGTLYDSALRQTIDTYPWNIIPKGVDTSKALDTQNSSLITLVQGFDSLQLDQANQTAKDLIAKSINTAESMAIQTMFDSLVISAPKVEKKRGVMAKASSSGFDKPELL